MDSKKAESFIFFIACNLGDSSHRQQAHGVKVAEVSLVETKWLAARLDDPDLVIIDASPTKQYLARRTKNAVSASSGAGRVSYRAVSTPPTGGQTL